jgi:hypothetical protein
MRLTRPRETEASFQHAVMELATLAGWKVFHPYLSIRSSPGFPDLLLSRPGEPIIFAELKVGNKQPTRSQENWLEALRQAQGCEVYCWRPSDWPAIAARLLPPAGARHRD